MAISWVGWVVVVGDFALSREGFCEGRLGVLLCGCSGGGESGWVRYGGVFGCNSWGWLGLNFNRVL